MATTSIWNIKGHLGTLIAYVRNPEKTEHSEVYSTDNSESDNEISNVVNYVMKNEKTDKGYFVTALNCDIDTAVIEMQNVKKKFGKEGGNIAFHGYQSFAEKEVNPDMAHRIGVQLAEELWGDRFQVIVTTHLDRIHHLHNHFVLNSVSFLDGKRYNDCIATYMEMRKTSDLLCFDYGLSVIENPKRGRAKHYGEHKAEQEGWYTYRGIVKEDVDRIISESFTEKQFFYKVKEAGYDIKRGKDITLCARGRPRGMKLHRNLGDEYSYESICRRILENREPQISKGSMMSCPDKSNQYENARAMISQFQGSFFNSKKRGGLQGLYFHYCYILGFFPNQERNTEPIPPALKMEIIKMKDYAKEIRLLAKNEIDTADELLTYKGKMQSRLSQSIEKRKECRKQLRRVGIENPEQIKSQITLLTDNIKVLRKEVVLCNKIEIHSHSMRETLTELQKSSGKEQSYDQRRRRSRTNVTDVIKRS